MVTGTELTSDERAESNARRNNGRASAKLRVAAVLAGIALVGGWLKYSAGTSRSSADTRPAALPQVVASKPLVLTPGTPLVCCPTLRPPNLKQGS
jgi:hypothetical protein